MVPIKQTFPKYKKNFIHDFWQQKNVSANLIIKNTPLIIQHDTKFLGVILSSNLKWNKHIDIVRSKIKKNIGIITKVRHLLPQELTRNLYMTLVNPYICYCNIIWSSPHKTSNLEKILKIPKKYWRLITFSKFTEASRPLFQKLHILSVYDTYKYQLLIHIYKTINKLIPISVYYYAINASIHDHDTRQRSNLGFSYVCVCICVHMYVYVYICIYVYVYEYMYVYICILFHFFFLT